MSIQPQYDGLGLRLGIGIVPPTTYLTVNRSKSNDEDSDRWALSSLKKKGRMYFRDMQILRSGTFTVASSDSGSSFDRRLEEVPYPVDQQAFWKDLITGDPSVNLIRDVDLQPNEQIVIHDDTTPMGSFYVPGSLVSNISKHEMSMTSDDGHRNQKTTMRVSASHSHKDFKAIDPTRKRRLVVAEVLPSVDARMDKEATTVMISTRGSTEAEISIHIVELNSSTGLFETKGTPTTINLHSRVKHIEFPILSKHLGKFPNTFAVLTNNRLHIVRIDHIGEHRIDTVEFTPLEFIDFEQFPIVDVTFNPWNIMEIAIIDSKGNWSLARLEPHKRSPCLIKLRKDASGSIYDPSEISLWHQIEWSIDHSSLVIMNRSRFVLVNIQEDWQHDIVQAKTWSQLRDYKRIDEHIGLLLTSKEIILLHNNRQGIKRLVSWKHDWDTNDPSIRLSFRVVDDDDYGDLIHVLVFSKLTVKVYGIIFGYKEGLWATVASKPFLLSLGSINSKDGLNSIELPVLSSPIYQQMEACATIKNFVCVTGFIGSDVVIQGFLSESNSPNKIHLDVSQTHQHYEKDFLLGINKNLQEGLLEGLDVQQIDDEYQAFQTFGYNLSEKLNGLLKSWEAERASYRLSSASLASLEPESPRFQNMTEFISLIEQLSTYYKEHNLIFSDPAFMTEHLIGQRLNSWEEFSNRFMVSWNSKTQDCERLNNAVTQDMTLHLTRFQEAEGTKTALQNWTRDISCDMKNIIELWDNETDDSQLAVQSDRASTISAALSSEQFKVPTVKSSQQTNKKRKVPTANKIRTFSATQPTESLKGTLPEELPPAFSLRGNTRNLQSQISSSQPETHAKPKRRKRVGGFN